MNIHVYYSPTSAPCRAVIMAATALELHPAYIPLDLSKNEHLKPEFLKLTPQHTVPTLEDKNDVTLIINESRAIMCYFADKYGKYKHNSLYPQDLERRAVIHQRLYFDCGTLYPRFADLYYPVIFWGAKSLDPSKKKKLEEAFGFLDKYLDLSLPWVAGADITLADFSIVATVSTAVACGFNLNEKNYPYVHKWFKSAQETIDDYEKINKAGIEFYSERAKKAKIIS